MKKNVVIDEQTNNLLHTARYGNRILVGYSLSTCLNAANVCASYSNTDEFYIKLVDYDGNNLREILVNTLPEFWLFFINWLMEEWLGQVSEIMALFIIIKLI